MLNFSLEVENSSVQISKCPNGYGKIKSPLCCAQNITCTLYNFKFSHNRNFWFLFFGIIKISIIIISVNFVNKDHNKTIIKQKNPINNKLKKYIKMDLLQKSFSRKTKENFKREFY